MKLVSWNVGGLRARMKKENGEMFQKFLEYSNPDIVCVQETQLQLHQEYPLGVAGYETIWNCAEGESKYGTAILTKIHPRSICYGIGMDVFDKQGRVIIAEFPSFYLVCYYSPLCYPETKNNWLLYQEKLRQCVVNLGKPKPVILCGDFNVTHRSMDSFADNGGMGCSEVERGKFSQLMEAGFIDTYRYLHADTVAYSWWRHEAEYNLNHGNRLDYFLVSNNLQDRVKDVQMYRDKVASDHCPIGLLVDIEK